MAGAWTSRTESPDRGVSGTASLLGTMVTSSRAGALATLSETHYAHEGARLERTLEAVIQGRIGNWPTGAIVAETGALVARTYTTLASDREEPAWAEGYATGIRTIDQARETSGGMLPAGVVAAEIHAAVIWYSAWHLAAFGMSIAEVINLIGETGGPADTQAGWTTPLAPAATGSVLTPDAREKLTAAAAAAHQRAAAVLSFAGRVAKNVARAANEVQAERTRRQAEARTAALERTARAADAGQPSVSNLRLDGNRMRSSAIGTWLMLVVLSWVALVWGALLAIPFMGPFGILGAMMGGFIAVPLWGTVWGFLGMGAARASTLSQMGFREAGSGDWLTITTAGLASRLDLPPPTVGTIPACNAFAMGTDHRHATVAIGQPLMDRLSRDEIAAIIGHELGHVASGDMRKMMLMRTFQNACVWYMLAQGLKQFMRWVICWAAELAVLAFSRRREYWADAVGAALTSKEAMIGALRKIEQAPALTSAERTHARFMFRGNPFSTHPSVAQRVAALEAETYLRRLPVRR